MFNPFRWLQAKAAALVGNIWTSTNMVAIFPYPAVVVGAYGSLVQGQDYRSIVSVIKPGDMLLTTQKKYMGSNSAIPGAFKHLMVYTGPVHGNYNGHYISNPLPFGSSYRAILDEFFPSTFNRTITHAESEGVMTFDLLDVFSHYDYIVVIRPWKNEQEQQAIVKAALSQNGKPYDFDFESENIDSIYCTELGAYCLEKAGIPVPPTIMKMTQFWKPWKKNKVYVADAFVYQFPIVCKTVSCNDRKIFKGEYGVKIEEKVCNAHDARKTSRDLEIKK